MRIVSLVPSLTETLHDLGLGGSLVGVTKFCVEPASARDTAAVIGGTKDPDVELILGMRPDLVVADEDENRPEHLEALRGAGLQVHTTRIENVADVARELRAIGLLTGRGHEAEKRAADLHEEAVQTASVTSLLPRLTCFVPIWKKPLMSIGARTYMSDLLRIAGAANIFADARKKYFEADLDEVRDRAADVFLLPTEPYRFREPDRKWFSERFDLPMDSIRIVDGQALTWFGTRTPSGLRAVADVVAGLRAAASPKPT